MPRHPTPTSLLEYADAEMEERQKQDVAEHLTQCNDCRDWLDEIETGVAQYKREWMPLLNERAPAPPAPWFDLRERLTELDRMPAAPKRSMPVRLPWAAIAAALLIAIAGRYWLADRRMSA